MAQHRFTQAFYALAGVILLNACGSTPDKPPMAAPEQMRPPAQQSGYPYPMAEPNQRETMPSQSPLPSRTVKVGLLLPLSGNAEMLGNALRDAAVLALFDKYATMKNPSVKVELVTKDTQGTADGARAAATAAVKEGASILLGPLFSRSVEAIKPLAKTGKVTIISFSNNKAVAGDGVYIMGFDPAEQAERVANFVYRQDINTVATLAPNDAYGRQVVDSFKHVADVLGRRMSPVIRYSAAGATLNNDIRTLVKEGTDGARFTFGALLLPEGGNKLGPILGGLAAMNVTPQTVRFIGTGLWDDRDIIRNHNLNGAWLASSPPAGYEAFEQRFKHSYDYKPPRLASLSYDAVALATTLADSAQGATRSSLNSPNGFYGPANGIFRFRKDGTAERGLAVLQVNGTQGYKVIDPAPTSFR